MIKIYVASPYTRLLKEKGTNEVLKVAKNAVSSTKKYLQDKALGYKESSYFFCSPVISNMFTNAKMSYNEILQITTEELKSSNIVTFFSDSEHISDFINSDGCFLEYLVAMYYGIPILGTKEVLEGYKFRANEIEEECKTNVSAYDIFYNKIFFGEGIVYATK